MTDGLSVLIVDDSEDLRELLSMVIERDPQGWHVVATAAEGEQAIVRRAPASPTWCCSTSPCP